MTIREAKNILMVGVAGTGMRGLAYLLASDGKKLSGTDSRWNSDRELLAEKDEPEFEAIELFREVSDVRWTEVDLVIYSDAVPEDSLWRLEAERQGVVLLPYQVALGQFAAKKRTIAVAGTHGKSSTTAFLSFILIQAGLDPTVLVGAATSFLKGRHAQFGKSDWLILEADEYRAHFLELEPEILVITSIDFDHADYFADKDAVVEVFRKLLSRMPKNGLVVVPRAVYENILLPWPERTIVVNEDDTDTLPEALPGRHMQVNGALAMGVAKYLEVPSEEAERSLKNFPGLKRRFERLGQWKDMSIISDYGHHPAEIEATLQAARSMWPEKKVAVMLEVHTEERLRLFQEQFIEALREAEAVWLYPVFSPAGREASLESPGRQRMLEALQAAGIATELVTTGQSLERSLSIIAKEMDVLLAFSAGNLDGELRKCLSI